MTKKFVFILLICIAVLQTSYGQTANTGESLFSVAALKEDIKYLKSKLENNHPGLYLYASKALVDSVFDSLENSIVTPLSEQEFYKHITIISSIIKDGHTIILPAAGTSLYHSQNSKFLPYHFNIIDGRLFIDMVYTADRLIPAGAEVTSINNLSANELIKQLSERQVRDGNNFTYPLWILSNYFRQYYSFVFGHPEIFMISFKINGQSENATIKALTNDSIYYYRQKAYPGRAFSKLPNEGIKLKIAQGKQYAILTIRDFHNDVLKNEYKQDFEKVIIDYFEQIENSQTANLVIDLRNNQGGDIENGVFLLSYLLNKPFSVVQEYFRVVNGELQHCNGPSLGLHKPKANVFNGKVYVLINGGSFSNSGIVSACLQRNNRAIFIGQETGGNPNVLAGFEKNTELPNTKIQVQIPTKQFVLTSKANNKGRGLMPDINSVCPKTL
jgi:hypothetical protein